MVQNKDDAMLGRELEKLGVAPGSAMAIRAVAALFPTQSFVNAFECKLGLEPAARLAYAYLTSFGQMGDLRISEVSRSVTVSGIVGSGILRLNPTALEITLVTIESGDTRISIRGAAKEGLIPQRSAEKAVFRAQQHIQHNS